MPFGGKSKPFGGESERTKPPRWRRIMRRRADRMFNMKHLFAQTSVS